MDKPDRYQPLPIPRRRHVPEAREENSTPISLPDPFQPEEGPFVEIEVAQPEPAVAPLPQAQILRPADEKRERFYAMREIARNDSPFLEDRARVFYQQAKFMEDFEDDYGESRPFTQYFPHYQLMGYEQLRTYFTWRTRVRRGEVEHNSPSYAFLYLYELLNNIGVDNPQDGLEKMTAFWRAYRAYNQVLDKYVLQWLKDYHVYYPLAGSFGAFAAAERIQEHYPSVFGYTSGREDSFDLFAGISKYPVKKSSFYGEETHPLFSGCFYWILSRLRERFGEKKRSFEDLVFHPVNRESRWSPFSKALFHPAYPPPVREVALSQREVYQCKGSFWTYRTVLLTERGRQLTGYIIKEMEVRLREAEGYRYKLTANPSLCDAATVKKLAAVGIDLPRDIGEWVTEFYRDRDRREVAIDPGNLSRIRREALDTQEKLIVPEAEKALPEDFVMKPAVGGPAPEAAPAPEDPWSALGAALDPTEREALALLLGAGDVEALAAEKGMMLEVLIDGINQKAVDFVGDAVVELEDKPNLYEDYRDKLKEMVGN